MVCFCCIWCHCPGGALHWFGSSIQQFTTPGMLSLGHARVGRASLAMVVFFSVGLGWGVLL